MALFHELPMGDFYLSSKTYTFMRTLLILVFTLLSVPSAAQSRLTIVELNAENLFDTRHDTLKNDYEFLPDSPRHWTRTKYWEKLNRTGRPSLPVARTAAAGICLTSWACAKWRTTVCSLTLPAVLFFARPATNM